MMGAIVVKWKCLFKSSMIHHDHLTLDLTLNTLEAIVNV